MPAVLLVLSALSTLFLAAKAQTTSYTLTFENTGREAGLKVYYVPATNEEYLIGSMAPGQDFSSLIYPGQFFVVRSTGDDDFRLGLQLDPVESDGTNPTPEYKITLVNIMADQPRRLFDIQYEGRSVGSSAFGAPHTEGIYFHNRIHVYDAMRQKVTFRAVNGAGEL